MSQPLSAKLPSLQELEVQELEIVGSTMKAAAPHLGKYCDELSKEYMLCKKELRDPRKCLKEGKELTACGLELLRKLKESCLPELKAYSECLDKSSGKMEYKFCKTNQSLYNDCVEKKLGIQTPQLGYFSQLRIHESSRPKPEIKIDRIKPIDKLPDDYEKKPVINNTYIR